MPSKKFNISSSRFSENEVSIVDVLETKENEIVCVVNPNDCDNWEYHDRQNFELGDLSALAQSMKIDQVQPVVLSKQNKEIKSLNPSKYVVIAGNRRWEAAKSHNLALKAIIRDLTVKEAIKVQQAENMKDGLSDYSVGIHFHRLMTKKIMSVKDIQEMLGVSQAGVYRVMSFAKVPDEIWKSVGDMSKVTPATAETILTLSKKGKGYINEIINLSAKIRSGIGPVSLRNKVEESINGKSEEFEYSINTDAGVISYKKNKINLPPSLNLKNDDIKEIIEKIKEYT